MCNLLGVLITPCMGPLVHAVCWCVNLIFNDDDNEDFNHVMSGM